MRAITGEPLFVGKDLCEALGYSNPNDEMKQHCSGVAKRYPVVDSLGRTQEARVLTEPDMYRLIAGSQLPAAQGFEARCKTMYWWLHGGYMNTPNKKPNRC